MNILQLCNSYESHLSPSAQHSSGLLASHGNGMLKNPNDQTAKTALIQAIHLSSLLGAWTVLSLQTGVTTVWSEINPKES